MGRGEVVRRGTALLWWVIRGCDGDAGRRGGVWRGHDFSRHETMKRRILTLVTMVVLAGGMGAAGWASFVPALF